MITPVRSKRQRCDTDDDDDDDDTEITFGDFEFSRQGTRVAVYYDDDFYVGEVVEVINKTSGNVTFMEKCGLKQANVYRWPAVVDVDVVSAQYILHWDFDVSTSNGRAWSVPDRELLNTMYRKYKQLYCT